jgi:ADP-ribosylglycohydrolase
MLSAQPTHAYPEGVAGAIAVWLLLPKTMRTEAPWSSSQDIPRLAAVRDRDTQPRYAIAIHLNLIAIWLGRGGE